MLHIGGLKVTRNVAGICLGPCPPPGPGRATKFGPVLSSCPYMVLQVIRLRHKRGCEPLAATRLSQREDGECQVGLPEASTLPHCQVLSLGWWEVGGSRCWHWA